MSQKIHIFIVAGEESGDILGSGLIRELKNTYGESIRFTGIAGEKMQAEGCEPIYPMERLSVMGIVAVLKRYRELSKKRKQLIQELKSNPPDCFIGIDAPEFNLDFELALKGAGIKTVHYVSPSVWAWRPKRIYKIKKAVDLMLCLFTFEKPFYQKHEVNVECVGHPLADQIPVEIDTDSAKQSFGIEATSKVLAVLPGSRGSELKYITQPFVEAAYICWKKNPELKILLPVVSEKRKQQLEKILEQIPDKPPIAISIGNSREVMTAADAILIASGTATLEATLLKKPMVVGYKMSALSYAIFSRMLNISNVSLPNLLANQSIVPELIQADCKPEKLSSELLKIFNDTKTHDNLKQQFKRIHLELLKNADEIAARAVVELLENKTEKVSDA